MKSSRNSKSSVVFPGINDHNNANSIQNLNSKTIETHKKNSQSTLPQIMQSSKNNQINLNQNEYIEFNNNNSMHSNYLLESAQPNSQMQRKSKKITKFRLLEARKELNVIEFSQMTPNTTSLKVSSAKLNPKQLIKHSHVNLLKVEDEDEEQDREESKNIMDKLSSSFEVDPEDKRKKPVVGPNAVKVYYKMYKKSQAIKQQNDYFSLPTSSQTAMSIYSGKQCLLPNKIGLIKQDGDDEVLNIQNQKFGDNYAKMLSEGLMLNQRTSDISDYYLRGNKISEEGANILLKTISRKAKLLDLANNNIGMLGCEHISMALKMRDCRIEHLNLEDNKLGDDAVIQITESLERNQTMKYLNLSKNMLTDKVADTLCKMLSYAPNLEQFYMHWNQITYEGGKKIFETLLDNEQLRVLDFSCNLLGGDHADKLENLTSKEKERDKDKFHCSIEIGEFIQKSQVIMHMDLSNNNFTLEQSKVIQKHLEKNKSMYGFHFSGNHGYVDNRMFLVINEQKNNIKDLTGLHVKQRIDGCKTLTKNMYRNDRDFELVDCCWICEGWSDHEFVWKDGESGEKYEDPFFVHFNYEDYRTCYTGKQNEQLTYKRAMPPGNTTYFFSSGEDEDVHMVAKDHIVKQSPEINQISDIAIYDGTLVDAELSQINVINIKKNMTVINEEYKPTISMLPRTRDPVYNPPKKLKKKVQWTFPISLMAKWRKDNDDLVKKCFEFDWSKSRIPKFVKKEDELQQIEIFLRDHYKHIKGAYKYFASQNPAGDIWGIQNIAFWEYIKAINIIDHEVTAESITLKQVAVQANSEKGNPRDFVNAIMRYQMMELLVRLAQEKYIDKQQVTKNQYEALTMLWNEHLENVMGEGGNTFLETQQKWREENYWNEESDYCLKHYKKIVDHVYKKFSKKKVKPGQQPFMCLDELQQIIQISDLQQCEHFGTEVGFYAFNLSMMTQIDELKSDRIFEMSQVEFYEALGRLADKANFEPHPSLQQELGDTNWPFEKRHKTKLGWRLEGLCIRLLETCCEPSFKAAYPQITKSFFCRPDDWEDYEQ